MRIVRYRPSPLLSCSDSRRLIAFPNCIESVLKIRGDRESEAAAFIDIEGVRGDDLPGGLVEDIVEDRPDAGGHLADLELLAHAKIDDRRGGQHQLVPAQRRQWARSDRPLAGECERCRWR